MTDVKKEKNLSIIIGIAVFLTLTVFLSSLIVFGSAGFVSVFVFLGVAVVIGLCAYWIKQHYPMKTLVFPFGAAIGTAILMLIIILLVGNVLIHDMPATFTYTVSVKGLDKYNGGLATDILVPIPMINGEQVFSDDELQYRQFGTWKSMLVVTPQGKMLAFQSISRNLTDIDAQWFREIRGKRVSVDILRDLLSPKTNQTAENITRGINYTRNGLGYPSQVYIDDVIKPIDGTSGNITFDLAFFVYEGMYLGFTGNTYEIRVSEEIPAGMTRMIPVQVQVGKYTECRLGTSEICLI